jgi:hypothetical protein
MTQSTVSPGEYAVVSAGGDLIEIRSYSTATEVSTSNAKPKHYPVSRVTIAAGEEATSGLEAGVWIIRTPAKSLAVFQAEAIDKIDMAAEAARLRFITGGAGQAMTYQTKLDQAKRQQAGDPGPFPLLLASVDVEGDTVAEVAELVIATAEQWEPIGADIEKKRLTAKRDILAAGDAAAISAIVAAVVWPSPA